MVERLKNPAVAKMYRDRTNFLAGIQRKVNNDGEATPLNQSIAMTTGRNNLLPQLWEEPTKTRMRNMLGSRHDEGISFSQSRQYGEKNSIRDIRRLMYREVSSNYHMLHMIYGHPCESLPFFSDIKEKKIKPMNHRKKFVRKKRTSPDGYDFNIYLTIGNNSLPRNLCQNKTFRDVKTTMTA